MNSIKALVAPVEISTGADAQLETIEIQLLLEGLFRRYGFDFRDYAFSSLKHRIKEQMKVEQIEAISDYQAQLLRNDEAMERLLMSLSLTSNAMFRDPPFYRAFRERIVPLLRTYPFIRIWNIGCSSGEEVYSIAIILQEEGLYERCRIYATDMNKSVIRKAQEGQFPVTHITEYTENYLRSGGKEPFSNYYTVHGDYALLNPSLKQSIVFALHNPVADRSFNEFHMILCRNVMIYYNKTLQNHVHNLLYESLIMFGFLGIGHRESLRLTAREGFYEELDSREKIYRKVR